MFFGATSATHVDVVHHARQSPLLCGTNPQVVSVVGLAVLHAEEGHKTAAVPARNTRTPRHDQGQVRGCIRRGRRQPCNAGGLRQHKARCPLRQGQ
jgi:hypothetical protein